MKRITLIIGVCLAAFMSQAIFFPSAASGPRPKYNVILIASDDLRATLGSYGNKIVLEGNGEDNGDYCLSITRTIRMS